MKETRHNPTIRELLDAVRPDSTDLSDSALCDAADALERSQQWQLLFENQRRFDRDVGAAIKEVEFSDDMKRRLTEALAADRNSPPDDAPQPATADQPSARRMSRRRWAYAATAAAALIACAGLGLLVFGNGPTSLTLDEIRGQIPLAANGQIDVSRLEPFDESFDIPLPTGRWERVRREQPRGLSWSGRGHHDAALIPFTAVGRRPVSGYLLILPATAVADPPATTILSTSGVSYFPTENTAWTNTAGDTVYLCFVEGGNRKLDLLQRIIYPHSA